MFSRPLLALTLIAFASARAQSVRPDPARIEHSLLPAVRLVGRADTSFDLVERMRFYHVPAVSIAVIDGDRVVYAKGFGTRTFGRTEPVDTSTLFLAGSISKPVFATGLLALVQQGKLNLDEDVNHYLKSWQLPESQYTRDQKVTLRRLLSHSAGLTVWGFPGYELGTPVPTIQQVLNGEKPANTPAVRNDTVPGARWLYSGGGITIAQLVTTEVTGEPFPELMRRLVLRPSGMVHSTYENPPPASLAGYLASGHERRDTPVPGGYHVYPEMAAAGLWTTPSDLARWAITLTRSYHGAGGGPLSPAMARQMLTPQIEVTGQNAGPVRSWWGLGVQLQGSGDSLRFSHGGRDEGFVANLFMWPKQQRGLVIMTNGVSNALIEEINRAFGEQYALPAGARVEKRLVSVDPATLDSLPGAYRVTLPRGDTIGVHVIRRGDDLWLSTSLDASETHLLPQGPDAFFDLDSGVSWRFERPQGRPLGAATKVIRELRGQRFEALRVTPLSS